MDELEINLQRGDRAKLLLEDELLKARGFGLGEEVEDPLPDIGHVIPLRG